MNTHQTSEFGEGHCELLNRVLDGATAENELVFYLSQNPSEFCWKENQICLSTSMMAQKNKQM